MRGEPAISSVYKRGLPDAAPPDWEQWSRIERLRRKAWLESGVVSVIPAELPEDLRSEIVRWAVENYGER